MSNRTLRQEAISDGYQPKCIEGMSDTEVVEMILIMAKESPEFRDKLNAAIRQELISPSETP